MQGRKSFDVAVVGAGVFGVWIAYQLRRTGAAVILLDGYGPANSRASSGGESRIIRMGYGPDEIYSRSAMRSFVLWHELFEQLEPSTTALFRETGVLWLAREKDSYCEATLKTLQQLGVEVEYIGGADLRQRYPQFNFEHIAWGILEPRSGALMARRAVQAVASHTEAEGTVILKEAVLPPNPDGRLNSISTSQGTRILADQFVFACGPWLPKLFPRILQGIIQVTRQEVFFFGTPAGDNSFTPGQMPIWIDFNDLVYALPDLENRGLKLASDAHGPEFDPDTGERVVSQAGLNALRTYLQRCIPQLAEAPVTETRVCQYENTSNGNLLLDRHPDFENAWLIGGGSGHGFKHGPAVAEYVVGLMRGEGTVEPRFGLSAKERVHRRQVY